LSLIGNILWFVLGGCVAGILWILAGLLLCVTIIGIPFGIQCLKIGVMMFCPFGKTVELGHFGIGGLLGNILWIIFFGWELCVLHFITALLLCITIVGIPFGIQHFKFAKLAILPFGARIT